MKQITNADIKKFTDAILDSDMPSRWAQKTSTKILELYSSLPNIEIPKKDETPKQDEKA